ncbi:MAG: hypothetical protein SFW35_04325 [Chitinophagales bacterium]|nr:hypothetical protein [Chitinophagales bacterium]
MMSKLFYTGAILVFLLAIGCGNSKKDVKEQLIGRWDFVQVNTGGQVIAAKNMNYPIIEFKQNGRVTTVTGNHKVEEDWVLANDSLIVLSSAVKPDSLRINLLNKENMVLENTQTHVVITLKPSTGEHDFEKQLKEREEGEEGERKESEHQ